MSAEQQPRRSNILDRIQLWRDSSPNAGRFGHIDGGYSELVEFDGVDRAINQIQHERQDRARFKLKPKDANAKPQLQQ